MKIFETFTKENNYENKRLRFAGSGATDISQITKDLEKKLKNYKGELIWKYEFEPNEQHNTIFRATKEKALIWTLNKE